LNVTFDFFIVLFVMHTNKDNLSKKILTWYDNNKRILPWRLKLKAKKSNITEY